MLRRPPRSTLFPTRRSSDLASGLQALAERLAVAKPDPASCCAVAAVSFDPHLPVDDRLMLGDACAMIPPFTGNGIDRKSTRLNSSHSQISYAVFCLKKKKKK